jgi:hypothetical protein
MKSSDITKTYSDRNKYSILPFDIKKFIILGFAYVALFVFYLVNIQAKQYFIIYKFYIFFFTFIFSFILDVVFNPDNDQIFDYFSIAVVNSMVAMIMYSIFTDLSINGMFDNFSNEKTICYLLMLILFVLCAINLIYYLIS